MAGEYSIKGSCPLPFLNGGPTCCYGNRRGYSELSLPSCRGLPGWHTKGIHEVCRSRAAASRSGEETPDECSFRHRRDPGAQSKCGFCCSNLQYNPNRQTTTKGGDFTGASFFWSQRSWIVWQRSMVRGAIDIVANETLRRCSICIALRG